MKLSAEQRNTKIHLLLTNLLKEARGNQAIEYPPPFTKEEVETLFTSHIWGHREITLTIILARLLDPVFKASEDFYACNPRSIYEKPIRELLRQNGIPHKKSGPLNVAKNSQKIDSVWAHNKRGDGMALVVADLVKKIEIVSREELEKFALAYVKRYLLEATKVASLNFEINNTEDPVFLYNLCKDLIINVPDGGSIPQFLVGTLIENFNSGNESDLITSGHLDSVSSTNTTSKKPGDVIEEFPDSSKRIYEITVKTFSMDRMMESHEAVKAFDEVAEIKEVFVICREVDVPTEVKRTSSSFLLGALPYQDIIYYFVDIFAWVQDKILFMPASSRIEFYAAVVDHVNEVNTSEKVKIYFTDWHKTNQS